MNMPRSREAKFITKKQASLRQLHAAIDHLQGGDYECAITLAGAAEGQLAGRVKGDFWQILKIVASEERADLKTVISELNETRDWLNIRHHSWETLTTYMSMKLGLRVCERPCSLYRFLNSNHPKWTAFSSALRRMDFLPRGQGHTIRQ